MTHAQFHEGSVFGQDTALACDVSIRMRSLTRFYVARTFCLLVAFLPDDVPIAYSCGFDQQSVDPLGELAMFMA